MTHGFGFSATVEAVGLYTDGFVNGDVVGSMHFIIECMERSSEIIELCARLRHPTSDEPMRKRLTPLYGLVAGLFKSGADVVVEGPWAALLPGEGKLRHEAASRPRNGIVQIFEDHLRPSERQSAIDPDSLSEIHRALSTVRSAAYWTDPDHPRSIFSEVAKNDTRTLILTHSSGLSVAALVEPDGNIGDHIIDGRRPASVGRLMDFFDVLPKSARTWGEIWANHSFGGKREMPEGLEILPDEIALVHNVDISRYRVADPTSLANLADFRFGPGKSEIYSGNVWIGIAEQFGANGRYELAGRCAEQARLRDESPDMNGVAEAEVARWRTWQEFADEQARSPAPKRGAQPPLRPLSNLLAKLDTAFVEPLRALAAEIVAERAEAQHWPRAVEPLRSWSTTVGCGLEFRGGCEAVTGKTLIDAGITPELAGYLGIPDDVIPPPERYPRIFTIRCGEQTLRGTMQQGVLLLEGNTSGAYALQ